MDFDFEAFVAKPLNGRGADVGGDEDAGPFHEGGHSVVLSAGLLFVSRGHTMSELQRIREEARKKPRKIALPEADEPRTLQAAAIAARAGVARVSLVTDDPSKVRAVAQSLSVDLSGVDLVEVPSSGPGHEAAKRLYLERM